jgi:hypothetical protein
MTMNLLGFTVVWLLTSVGVWLLMVGTVAVARAFTQRAPRPHPPASLDLPLHVDMDALREAAGQAALDGPDGRMGAARVDAILAGRPLRLTPRPPQGVPRVPRHCPRCGQPLRLLHVWETSVPVRALPCTDCGYGGRLR